MYPDDRVLVAYVPTLADFSIIEDKGWYRIPQRSVPKGLFAEYFAFYFGRPFGEQKWAIHYYAERLGHELVSRKSLFPKEVDHPKADELYYKIQLGALQLLKRPIVSLRWRRVTFLHTTWDRFENAVEVNDLFLDSEEFVDRKYVALKDRDVHISKKYGIKK